MNYRLVARTSSKSADLFLYDDIGDGFFGGISSKQIIDDLGRLGMVDTLNVRINSAGGSVFEGLAIHNAIARNPARVVVHVDSVAASIASVIAMAGAEIRIADNARIMIHDPSGVAVGTAEEMRATAGLLDSVRGTLIDVYTKRTKNDAAKVSDWMSAETWFTARDAVQYGFADSITEPLQIAASGDFSRFKNAPAAIKAKAPGTPQLQLREARLSEVLRRHTNLDRSSK